MTHVSAATCLHGGRLPTQGFPTPGPAYMPAAGFHGLCDPKLLAREVMTVALDSPGSLALLPVIACLLYHPYHPPNTLLVWFSHCHPAVKVLARHDQTAASAIHVDATEDHKSCTDGSMQSPARSCAGSSARRPCASLLLHLVRGVGSWHVRCSKPSRKTNFHFATKFASAN